MKPLIFVCIVVEDVDVDISRRDHNLSLKVSFQILTLS